MSFGRQARGEGFVGSLEPVVYIKVSYNSFNESLVPLDRLDIFWWVVVVRIVRQNFELEPWAVVFHTTDVDPRYGRQGSNVLLIVR